MAKVRVYELAKEMGVESKALLVKLNDLGEFVRSASSTVEAPVVRKLREAMGPSAPANKAGKKAAATKPTPSADSASADTAANGTAPTPTPTETARIAPVPGSAAPAPRPPAPVAPAAQSASTTAPVAPAPRPTPAPATSGPAPSSPAPVQPEPQVEQPAARGSAPPTDGRAGVPGPRPTTPARPGSGGPGSGAPGQGRPAGRPAPVPGAPRPRSGAPRPGNNPFSSTQGMGRGTPRRDGAGSSGPGRPAGRPAGTASVPGVPRPNPGMMPQQSATRPGPGRGGPGGARGGGRGAPGGFAGRGAGSGRPAGAPAGAPGRPGGARGGGRGGRGQAPGAFGRPGGRPSKGRKSRKQRRQEFDTMDAPTVGGVRVRQGNGETVRLARGASLTDFAEKIGVDAASLVQVMFHLGEMVTATASVSDETLQVLGTELNYDIQVVSPEEEDRELLESFDIEFGEDEGGEAAMQPRPPVVTVMGHVDHGKTRLLDAIRQSNKMASEAGGITQHIGAYQVATDVDGTERKITFIDTPGHEAFTAMRARGASATDIVVLVVAADDGVMPQTIEALNHAKAAGVPIVVAVNKIDLPGADPSKARGQLTEYGLVPEEYGGDTMFVDVSAKSNVNIDGLLESIVLTADAALDLHANPDQQAQGISIEAHLDRGRGPVSTVLVQRGTLRVGDPIVAGPAYGRVRALLDDQGVNVDTAPPSYPVQVLGLTAVPGAGDNFLVVDDDRTARQIAERREARERSAQLARRPRRRTLEQVMEELQKGETSELLLILKGDVSGSVEALEDSLAKIEVGEGVALRVIHRGVGAINQNDVMLASIDHAIILGFNVRPEGKVGELAEREGVDVRFYSVIYAAIEDVENALKGMLKPVFEEAQLGTAEVREVFRSSKAGTIAGCLVQSGLIRRNAKARLIRDGAVVADSTIGSLRRFSDDATEVREGYECGLTLSNYNDLRAGDTIETYEMREIART